MLEQKPWDHAVELTDDFQPKKACIIPLSDEELWEVLEFMKEQLVRGYIRPSKSP